jgi:hypothetical protein
MCTNADCNGIWFVTCLRPEGITMTDMQDARRGTPLGVAPKITTYTGASYKYLGSQPPDPNGAVDRGHIVEFINDRVTIYDKRTGNEYWHISPGQFWQSAGVSAGGTVDPRIVFIPDAGQQGQWLAVQLVMGKSVLMATTDPSYPDLGRWKGSSFALRGNDFTMLGYDATGVYIGLNVEYGQGRVPYIAVIPRWKALSFPPQIGGPGDVTIIGPLKPEDYGSNLYPVIDQSKSDGTAKVIGVDTVTNKHLTYSLISNGTIVYHDKIAVPPFIPVPPNQQVKQPYDADGTQSRVHFDSTGQVAAPMRDGSNVRVAHTVWNPQFGSMVIRWYRLRIDASGRLSLWASGEIRQYNFDLFNPSILSFGDDDYTIVSCSRSGNSSTSSDPNSQECGNIGAYVALVAPSGQYEVFTLRSGLANNYIPNQYQRWGDYSTICRDPTSSRTAWIFNHYVTQGGENTSQNCDVIARIDLPPL